jgi:hypothetical protein
MDGLHACLTAEPSPSQFDIFFLGYLLAGALARGCSLVCCGQITAPLPNALKPFTRMGESYCRMQSA